jgi:hypothetical protein
MKHRVRNRVLAACCTILTALGSPGCFAVDAVAPYGHDVRVLAPEAPVEVTRTYQKWYAVWGIFPISSFDPSDIIAKEQLVEARVRTVDSLQDIYVGALTFLLFPFGLILPQTVVVEGNRQPTTVPDTGGQ